MNGHVDNCTQVEQEEPCGIGPEEPLWPGPTASSTTGINNNLQKFFHFLQSALPLALVEEKHKNTGI